MKHRPTIQHAPFALWAAAFCAAALAMPAGAWASSDCGDLSLEGECQGNTARWCEHDQVYEFDCEMHGMECGWDEDDGWYTCLDGDSASDDCDDGLDWAGQCQGDQVLWCEYGETQKLTCKEGTECAWNPEGYFDCLPQGQAVPNSGTGSGGTESGEPPGSTPSEEGGEEGESDQSDDGGAKGSAADGEDAEAWNSGSEGSPTGNNLVEDVPAAPTKTGNEPSVPGPSDESDDDSSAGCNAAPSPAAPFGWAALIALLAIRRRR